jgi:hypothetical protein
MLSGKIERPSLRFHWCRVKVARSAYIFHLMLPETVEFHSESAAPRLFHKDSFFLIIQAVIFILN